MAISVNMHVLFRSKLRSGKKRFCVCVIAVNAVSGSSSAAMSASNSFNGSAAQILAPYAAAAAAATGFPSDVLGMMPYFYPGLAGYYPGAGIPFMQPPAILPGTSCN